MQNTTTQNQTRITWIDTFKGIGILLMLAGHIIPGAIPDTAIKPESLIISYIYSFHMPLFFFASGMTFSTKKYPNYPAFLWNRIKTILFPFLFFLLVPLLYRMTLQAFNLAGPIPPQELLNTVLYANGASLSILNMSLWFLPCLFLAQNLMYFLSKLFRNALWLAITWLTVTVLGICLGRVFYPQELPWSAITAVNGASLMVLGVIYRKYEDAITQKLKLNTPRAAVLCGVLGLVLCLWNGRIGMASNHYGRSYALYYLTVAASFIFYIWISKKLSNSEFLRHCGVNTVTILGLHGTVINLWNGMDIYNRIGTTFNYTIDPLTHLLLETLLVTLTLLPCIWFINKFLPFCIGKTKK